MIKEIYLALNNYGFPPKKPLAAYLNLTDRCNLRCTFCELGRQKNVDSDGELALEEIWRIFDELNNWGVDKIYLGGGEPFMRPDVWEIIQFIASKKMTIWQIITNGTLLGKLNTSQGKLLKTSVKALNISLDSQDPQLHDSIRGVPGTFMKVISFLEKSTKEDFPVIYITCVITRDTFREIPELIRFLSHYNIKHIGFQPMNFYSNYPDYKVVEDKERFLLQNEKEIDELRETIEEGIKVSKVLKVSTNLSFLRLFLKEYLLYAKTSIFFFDRVMRNFICSNVFNYLYIDSKGNLLPCSLLPKVDNVIGKDLKWIWRRRALFLKKWSLQKRFYPECQSCHCGFASNLRHCLIYHIISNFPLAMKALSYYFMRSFRL